MMMINDDNTSLQYRQSDCSNIQVKSMKKKRQDGPVEKYNLNDKRMSDKKRKCMH